MKNYLIDVLTQVKDGKISVDEAARMIKSEPFRDMGFAKVDTQRKLRNGACEVIYGEGKTAFQINEIVKTLISSGEPGILITRLDAKKAEEIEDITYYEQARLGIVGEMKKTDGLGKVAVLTAGTSDIPVAEEAALTAEFLGNEVIRVYDVGVAGLHRLLANLDAVMSASVIIAVAGMEGALASVVGGLCDCPVIAVPTSVGYGAAFEGVTALLSMMNSCSSGVSVVNIDNGFGAGYLASMINHMEGKK
ncbi:MAG: nickel pincer cofactor biosynthesis protein LarB [Oscillospiraceae bacterium]|nr:nickel pincer cofactor biosynthesis protein LarB [Oscillospiraceae bacterium]MBQ4544984.1 nickel pincer cofactor biosynthesis protein LarB [Oscillospiraceae bacterium]